MSSSVSLPAGCREDCTVLCRSTQHAAQAIACVLATPLKYSSDETKVFLRSLCWNFHTLSDRFGRTVLHAASSSGCVDLVEWLIDVYKADPNHVDSESSWSSLHRAAFYGHLGVICALLQRGASLDLPDREGLTPLDLIVRDRVPWAHYNLSNPCSLYVWGNDENLSLGLGRQNITSTPKVHPEFDPSHRVKSVVVERYHTLFLTESGQVWACGHAHGGRLGMGDEEARLTPQQIPAFTRNATVIVQIAAAQDHSIFLDEEGTVYTCGLNTHYQLGLSAKPPKYLEPLALDQRGFLLEGESEIRGVAAGKYHSALWTDFSLYTWGLNAGQLGHPKQGARNQILPRKVSGLDSEHKISHVSCGEGAIGVVTTAGKIFLVHDYHVRRLTSRLAEIVKIAVVGGHIDPERFCGDAAKCTDLKVLVLNSHGDMFLWEGKDLVHSRVMLYARVHVTDFSLSTRGHLHLVSKQGEVINGLLGRSVAIPQVGWSVGGRGSGGRRGPGEVRDRSRVSFVDGRRMPNLHRTVAIAGDPNGKRFIALQNGPEVGVRSLKVSAAKDSQFTEDIMSLLELNDDLGDVEVTCSYPLSHGDTGPEQIQMKSSKTFILHSVILRARSKVLRAWLSNNKSINDISGRMTYNVENARPEALERVINLLYQGRQPHPQRDKDIFELAQRLEIHQGKILSSKTYPDIFIETADGEYKAPAHRCVLACRSEYFRGMFTFGGNDARTGSLQLPIAKDTLNALLEYIYTDSCSALKSSSELPFMFDVLAVADQLLLPRLKSMAEKEIFSRPLGLNNVCELFELANSYYADALTQVCADFICVNLTAILEGRLFDNLTTDGLERLGYEYRVSLPEANKRTMRGELDPLPNETIAEIYKRFKTQLNDDAHLLEIYEVEKSLRKLRIKDNLPRRRTTSEHKNEKRSRRTLERTISTSSDTDDGTNITEANVGSPRNEAAAPLQASMYFGTSPKTAQRPIDISGSPVLKSLDAFPALGQDVPLATTPPRSATVIVRSGSGSGGSRRVRHRPLDEVLDTKTPQSIAKCPWANINSKQDDNGNAPAKNLSQLEQVVEAEEQNLKMQKFASVARADAEDRAIADLMVVYEVGYNPDERVTIERVKEMPFKNGPIWAKHPASWT